MGLPSKSLRIALLSAIAILICAPVAQSVIQVSKHGYCSNMGNLIRMMEKDVQKVNHRFFKNWLSRRTPTTVVIYKYIRVSYVVRIYVCYRSLFTLDKFELRRTYASNK